MNKNTTRDLVVGLITEIDPSLSQTEPVFSYAMVVGASVFLGANEAEIASEMEMDRDFVDAAGSRLRRSGLWKDGKVPALEHWSDEDGGGIAFLLAVSVASGDVKSDDDGESFSITSAGEKTVEQIKKRNP